MKWIKYFLVILVILAVCAWSLRFFIGSKKFSNMLTQKIEESINGSLEMDGVDFDMFPSVGFKLQNLVLKDAAANEVLRSKDATFGLVWSSLLALSPRAEIQINQATLSVVQDADGKINLVSLLKKSNEPKSNSDNSADKTEKKDEESTSESSFVNYLMKSKVDLLLNDAVLSWKSPENAHEFKEIYLAMDEIGLNDSMSFNLSHKIVTRKDAGLKINGKNALRGELTLTENNAEISKIDLKVTLNSENLDIQFGKSFHKPTGQEFGFDADLSLLDKSLDLRKLDFKVADAELQVAGTVSDVFLQKGLNLTIKSNKMSANQLTNLVSKSSAVLKSGFISVVGSVTGDAERPRYASVINLDNFVSKQAGLRNDVNANGVIKIRTNEVEDLKLKINSGKSNFDIAGRLKDFETPDVHLTMRADSIDLDDLLEAKKTPSSSSKVSVSQSSKSSPAGAASGLDKTLVELGKDPFLRKTKLKFDVKSQSFSGMGLSLTNISMQGKMQRSIVFLDSMSWQGYRGGGNFSGKLDLSQSKPLYDGKVKIKNINFESLMSQFSPTLKNTAAGTFFHEANFKGASLDGPSMLKSLDVSGKFSLDNGVFRTVDVVEMANSAINGGLKSVAKAFSWLKLPNKSWVTKDDSKYEFMRGNFNLKNGVLRSKVFNAKSLQGKGLDIEGDTVINLINDDLKADWYIKDTYNQTKLKDIKAEFKGVKIERILMDASGVLKLPVSIGCKLSKPCYKYDRIPAYFTKNVSANVERAIKGKVKKRIQKEKKKLMNNIKKKTDKVTKSIGGKAKKEVNKMLKKFGF